MWRFTTNPLPHLELVILKLIRRVYTAKQIATSLKTSVPKGRQSKRNQGAILEESVSLAQPGAK